MARAVPGYSGASSGPAPWIEQNKTLSRKPSLAKGPSGSLVFVPCRCRGAESQSITTTFYGGTVPRQRVSCPDGHVVNETEALADETGLVFVGSLLVLALSSHLAQHGGPCGNQIPAHADARSS